MTPIKADNLKRVVDFQSSVTEPGHDLIASFVDLLRCPFCGGKFNADGTGQNTDELEYGVLSCYCASYPVVAGIPVLKKGVVGAGGETADDVIKLIQAGRNRDALLTLLMPPPPSGAEFAPSWMQKLRSVRGIGRLKTVVGRRGVRHWKEEGESLFTGSRNDTNITQLFDFYFRHMGVYGCNNYTYFSYRLGQPRYLVALSLASMIREPVKPVLDLGCGFGNITRFLVRHAEGQPVVGIDQNFFSLYVAKNYLATGGRYICAMGDISLPLLDGSCSVAFCSDAFQLFLHQANCIRELKRVTRDSGMIIVASVRNALVKKDLYGSSIVPCLPPEGYRELVADMPHRLVSNNAIIDQYVKKEGPCLTNQANAGELNTVQWMSLVASYRSEALHDQPDFQDWPNLDGEHLGLNPIYREESKDQSGNVQLRRVFPSDWHEQEDSSHRPDFLPERVTISPEGFANIAQERRTPEIEKLVAQEVAIGIPEPYLKANRAAGWTRALSVLIFLMLVHGVTTSSATTQRYLSARRAASSLYRFHMGCFKTYMGAAGANC